MAAPTVIQVFPTTLEGRHVRLEPAQPDHARSLASHAEIDLFQYFLAVRPTEQSEAAVADFLRRQATMANVIPFVKVLTETGEAVGGTTYMDIRPEHRGLEIGMTWIGRAYQGTKVNAESKLLMLRYAFEEVGCERVQLKCDGRNLQSQRAIEKLGAKREGVLRKHLVLPDGFVRDTVMYSIVRDEWPTVRDGLLARLGG